MAKRIVRYAPCGLGDREAKLPVRNPTRMGLGVPDLAVLLTTLMHFLRVDDADFAHENCARDVIVFRPGIRCRLGYRLAGECHGARVGGRADLIDRRPSREQIGFSQGRNHDRGCTAWLPGLWDRRSKISERPPTQFRDVLKSPQTRDSSRWSRMRAPVSRRSVREGCGKLSIPVSSLYRAMPALAQTVALECPRDTVRASAVYPQLDRGRRPWGLGRRRLYPGPDGARMAGDAHHGHRKPCAGTGWEFL